MDLQKLIEYMQLHEQIWTESLMDGSNDSMHEINRTHTQTDTDTQTQRQRQTQIQIQIQTQLTYRVLKSDNNTSYTCSIYI